jgi:DNA-binding transcriptional LysR family regulator
MSILKDLTDDQVFLMEIRQLKSLCLIAQYGTVKEAAKRCFLTSSAVSLQIKTLEKELGIRIFARWQETGSYRKRRSAARRRAQDLNSVREAVEWTVTATGEFTGKISVLAPRLFEKFLSSGDSPLPRYVSVHTSQHSCPQP